MKKSIIIYSLTWFLILLFLVLFDKPLDNSIPSTAYIPQLIRIPDSVYSLSESILRDKINLPNIPTKILDLNLEVLNVRVSRLRSGGSAIFILKKQKTIINFNFWCLFDDQSITPVYIYYVKKSKGYITFLECSLPNLIIQYLWYNRTIDREIKIYLSTTNQILLQGFLDIPWSNWVEDTDQSITLCTYLLDIELIYFIQWIEFHRFIGISKFIIYNISNINQEFYSTINSYQEEYPGLIDILQWKSSITEIQYDCFIRYSEISEWMIMININEYLIPQIPYNNLPRLLTEQYGRHLQISVQLENHYFCSDDMEWKDLLIEQYMYRNGILNRSNKYLYRSRTIDYLSINRHSSFDQMKKNIILAHYPIKEISSNCLKDHLIKDTTIRDRFARHLYDQMYK